MTRRMPAARPSGSRRPPASEIARLLAEGARRHQHGDLRKAENCYRQVLRLDSRQPDALHLSGLVAYQSGDRASALTLINQALAVDARQAPFHNSQGVVLLALDRLAEAEQSFRRALDRDPLYAEALNNLGNALQRQDRAGRCRRCLRPGDRSAAGIRRSLVQPRPRAAPRWPGGRCRGKPAAGPRAASRLAEGAALARRCPGCDRRPRRGGSRLSPGTGGGRSGCRDACGTGGAAGARQPPG